MSRHVSKLVTAGLVRREEHATDARRHSLHLTDEGKRIIRRVKSRRTEWLASRLRMLPEDDLDAIRGAIAPLGRLLEREPA